MSQTLRECLLLLPCSGLDDFPEAVSSEDSRQLLNGWLSLWHPLLIDQVQSAPRWQSADQPPHDMAQVLAVCPEISRGKLPSDFQGTAERAGGWLQAADTTWRALQARWVEILHLESQAPMATANHWQTEFAALGYAYLQIQLLTRQLRYTSNLDQVLFDSQLLQAARSSLAGDEVEAEKMLQSCFDQLGQERDHYYSLDVSLLDVTLLAPTTLGTSLASQLERAQATSLVASADLLAILHSQQPAIAEQLQHRLKERTVSIAGGLATERPHPLMTFDGLRRDLQRGRAAYESLAIPAPTVFTRLSFGQLSDMPLHLRRSGFTGSLLIAWHDGSYPTGSHAKFSWEAAEGTFLNAVAPALGDASDDATYMSFGRRIADALDHQHVPLFMLAHWPSAYSAFHELLLRVVARTPAMGRWQTVDDFFDKTDQPYHQEHLSARKFSLDWLSPDRQVEPTMLIECSVAHQNSTARLRTLLHLLNLSYQLENFRSRPEVEPATPTSSEHDDDERWPQALPLARMDEPLSHLADAIDALFDHPAQAGRILPQILKDLDQAEKLIGARFAKATGHRPIETSAGQPAPRMLVANATSAPQRITLRTPATQSPVEGAKWLYGSGPHREERLALVDLPGYSLLAVPFQAARDALKRKETAIASSNGLLFNDFLEAQIDPRTGNLRSLHVPGKRGNRLSIQLARREKASGGACEYSLSQATSVTALESSSMHGKVRATGQLQFRGLRSGEFEIDYELTRGSRVLAVTVKLDGLEPVKGSAWSAGYVLRTAWPNESSLLSHWMCGSRLSWPSGKAVAPSLIEIDDADHRIYLMTAGLAFHQRVEERFLETILSAAPARNFQYRFGIGIDLPNPVIASRQFGSSPISIPIEAASGASTGPAASATWLMNIDAKQVVMDLDSALVDRKGVCAGVRIHLSEIAGKSVTARIRSLRDVDQAHRVDYLGGRIAKLTVEADTTSIALRPNEMTFVDLIWKS